MAGGRQLISIVIPVHNEELGLPALHAELRRHIDALPYDFELLFVNDGSTDLSLDVIEALHRQDPRVRGIDLSRNYGHQAALTAGTHAARGDAVIHMDADLQHPPALIPAFIERWQAGAHIVETQRQDHGASGPKHLLSAWFYRVFNRISETKLVPGAADFRLLDRACVDVINSLPERHRFLRGITQWIGFNRETLPYTPGRRHAGTPSYTWRKSLRLALHGIFHFSNLPLRLAFYLGAFILAACFLYLAAGAFLYFTTDRVMSGWVSTILVILLVGGVNLLFTGVLSIYVWMMLDQIRQRPTFIVRGRIGFGEAERPAARAHGPAARRQDG